MNLEFSFFTPNQHSLVESSTFAASDFVIRDVNLQDLDSIAEILADSFHSRTGIMQWLYPVLRLGIYEDLRTRLRSKSPNQIGLVAVIPSLKDASGNEYVAGTIEMAMRSCFGRRSSGSLYISNLAVSKTFRRQGVADKLLKACDLKALEWGFKEIELHVLDNNYPARQLYQKNGFQLQENEPDWILQFLNQPQKLLLRKSLANLNNR
ncbi:GCN5-related N-acetyltransferase [Crinalium epipsammum PCC 9333]|uniref:GCN5-related N-acetyltransferase n=1 Tax=Crinalium epipsammum PCC 9333 TaxID=1173022 RepID=K9W4G1_9CYAN|nr:N-acetyltransferase [Crinalium epipsammum]AFZ14684.1 GCN5-related N-acetyltransferase [Crinalium epipsammum PCC 9333]